LGPKIYITADEDLKFYIGGTGVVASYGQSLGVGFGIQLGIAMPYTIGQKKEIRVPDELKSEGQDD
jgi:hypothetical protein